MRITCPLCGPRDRREFHFMGAALPRPAADAPPEAWDAYLHLRDNPAGTTHELWQHEPCGAWLVVHRDTRDHAVHATALAAEAGPGAGAAAMGAGPGAGAFHAARIGAGSGTGKGAVPGAGAVLGAGTDTDTGPGRGPGTGTGPGTGAEAG